MIDMNEMIGNKSKLQKFKEIIARKYESYRKMDRYSITFTLKTGKIITKEVDTIQAAEKYKTWYEQEQGTYEVLELTPTESFKITQSDIEKYEFGKVSLMERYVLQPLATILTFPLKFYISFKIILMGLMVAFGLIVGGYYFSGYAFTGTGSINTLVKLSNTFSNFAYMINEYIALIVLINLAIELLSKRQEAVSVKSKSLKNSVVMQFIVCSMIPIGLHLFSSIAPEVLKMFQRYGYFLF